MTTERTAVNAYARALYPLALAVAIFPLADMVARLVPIHLGNAQWRFGAVGLVLSGSLVMMMLGLALLGFTASEHAHRKVLGPLAVAAFAIVGAILVALILFALDAIQLRPIVRPEVRTAMRNAAISAIVGGLLSITGFTAIGLAALRARRVLTKPPADSTTPALVVGLASTSQPVSS